MSKQKLKQINMKLSKTAQIIENLLVCKRNILDIKYCKLYK